MYDTLKWAEGVSASLGLAVDTGFVSPWFFGDISDGYCLASLD